MPNLGPTELIVILVIALLVFGPKRLPDLGRSVGRGLREFKKARDEVTGAIKLETKDLGLDAKELGLDAKELGLSAKDLDPNAPLTPAQPAAATATGAAAAGSTIAAAGAAPTNGGASAAATAASAAAATAGAETATDAADAPDTNVEPNSAAVASVVDGAESPAPPTDPALLGYDEGDEVSHGEVVDDEVLHGEVVDDEPAPLSAPSAPSAPRDADPA